MVPVTVKGGRKVGGVDQARDIEGVYVYLENQKVVFGTV